MSRQGRREAARDAWLEVRSRIERDAQPGDGHGTAPLLDVLDRFFGRYAGKAVFNASELPRVQTCPASWAESKGHPDITDDAAAFGRAFHECMEVAAKQGRGAVSTLEIATRHGVEVIALTRLFDRFRFDPTGGVAEYAISLPLESATGSLYTVSGVVDLVRPTEGRDDALDVIDYKTTWRVASDPEPWHDPQTKAYALAVLADKDLHRHFGRKVERVFTFKAYPRLGDRGWSAAFEVNASNAAALEQDLARIAEEAVRNEVAVQADRTYQMSHFCDYCPGRAACPAVRREFTAAVSATREVPILKKDGTPGKRTSTVIDLEVRYDNALPLFELAKLLKKSSDGLRAAVKDFVSFTGPIPEVAGKYLAIRRVGKSQSLNEKNLLDAARALGIDLDTVRALVEWVKMLPKRYEERLDLYTEAQLEDAGDEDGED